MVLLVLPWPATAPPVTRDPAAVQLDEAADDGEPDAEPALRTIETGLGLREEVEDTRQHLGRDSDALSLPKSSADVGAPQLASSTARLVGAIGRQKGVGTTAATRRESRSRAPEAPAQDVSRSACRSALRAIRPAPQIAAGECPGRRYVEWAAGESNSGPAD